MADVGAGKLGNAISGQWHDKMYLTLSKRQTNINQECQQCPWYSYCKGRCMMESFTETGSFYSRPNNCTAWKIVFKALDDNIKKHGKQVSIDWINKIQDLEYSRIDYSKINHSKNDCSNNKPITVNQSTTIDKPITVNQSIALDNAIAVVMQ